MVLGDAFSKLESFVCNVYNMSGSVVSPLQSQGGIQPAANVINYS